MVDASGCEGRDPVADVYAINSELENYDKELSRRPMIIAANKTDIITEGDPVAKLKAEFEPKGIKVIPISAATKAGINDLIGEVRQILSQIKDPDVVFASEYTPVRNDDSTSYDVFYDEKLKAYCVEGPKIEKMLGYTNLDSEKGFSFFQKFMEENGINEKLKEMGISEGDTVKIYGWEFAYYD